MELTKIDRILIRIFKNYTFKIFCIGAKVGFKWEDEENNNE